MSEPTYSFRYLEGSEVPAMAVGVNHRFDDFGLRMEFFTRDPTGHAQFVVFKAIHLDSVAAVMLHEALAERYSPPTGDAPPTP